LRQVATTEHAWPIAKASAEVALARCYMKGVGVDSDTGLAAMWCQRAVAGGDMSKVGRCRFDPGYPAVFAVDPTLAFRNFQLLKLIYDKLLSNVAFNFNLRPSGNKARKPSR
jgi:hypothetical protein